MAQRQIPNLAPAVFVSPTAQLEIVQDGVTMRASAGQIADLAATVEFDVLNNVTDTSVFYPIYLGIYEGHTNVAYASSPNYLYVPNEGRLSALRLEAMQGIVFNNSVTSQNYTFPAADNATSCGPLTLTADITVPTGSEWVVL